MRPGLIALTIAVLLAGCGSSQPQAHYYDDPFAGKGAPASAMDAVNATRAIQEREHPGAHLAYVTLLQIGNATGIAAPWDIFYVDANATSDFWYVGVHGNAAPGGVPVQAPVPPGFPANAITNWTVDSDAVARNAMEDAQLAQVMSGANAKVRYELRANGDGSGAAWHVHGESAVGTRDLDFAA